MTPLDTTALASFATIVDEGGFEAAAQRLSITQSAISHRLRTLESAIGQPLLVRSRPLVLTETGKLLLRYARQLNALQIDLTRDLSSKDQSLDERISIAVNADSLATWIPRALDSVVQRGIRLEILVDDQDFTHEWLKQGQALGCVSTVPNALQGCIATRLGSMRYCAAMSPRLFEQLQSQSLVEKIPTDEESLPQGKLKRQALDSVPWLVFNRKDDMQGQWAAKALGLKRVRLLETFVPSTEASVRAMIMGWGIGVAPQLLLEPLIKKGQLIAVNPQIWIDVELYWHRWILSSTTLDLIGVALEKGTKALAPSS